MEGVREQEFGGAKRFMSREERETRRWEDAAVKENAKLRVAQEREAKRMAEQADKEHRAAVRKQDVERRRQCASRPPACTSALSLHICIAVGVRPHPVVSCVLQRGSCPARCRLYTGHICQANRDMSSLSHQELLRIGRRRCLRH